jgi:hypothetical protein
MYRISKSAEFDKIKFTKWLRSVRWFRFNTQENNIKEALAIAGRISNGETIDIAWLFDNEFESGEMVCEIVKLEVEENKWVAELNHQAEYNALMARGAAGDANAAIEYCRLVDSGMAQPGVMYAP